ncbi:MAG: serine hydrolase [Patescibacteria group bacterium]|nr:serine hydrolase [Patescibacteria group bacterium]MDD4304369.1 serine hydrolase [Patescibacteria group bacterium]MDD4695392.1 serine hydrolase [Patescibacteria group bacterium]
MNLFYIIANILPIINIIALPVNNSFYFQTKNIQDKTFFEIIKQENQSNYPIKKANDSLGVKISAKSALVQDVKSKKILWSKNKDEIRSIASITKLMTGLVLVEIKDFDWEKEVIINDNDNIGDFNKLKISVGDTIKLRDLFNASIITSSNNGIETLIKNSGIKKEKFIEMMNSKTKEIGMKNTSFKEPTGLDPENVSTASDLTILLEKTFSYPIIKESTSKKNYTFKVSNSREITVSNTNELIGNYLNIYAGKTGYTEKAGFCLVSEVGYENKGPIRTIVLGSESHYERFGDLKTLSTWIFNNYIWN